MYNHRTRRNPCRLNIFIIETDSYLCQFSCSVVYHRVLMIFFFFTSDSLDFYFEIKYKEVHCCWGIHLVQEARGAAAGWAQGGSPRQGPMKCSPCAEQRSWDLWPSQWIGLSETQQQPRSSHFLVLRLGRYKTPGFPFFGVLLRGTSLSWYFLM